MLIWLTLPTIPASAWKPNEYLFSKLLYSSGGGINVNENETLLVMSFIADCGLPFSLIGV